MFVSNRRTIALSLIAAAALIISLSARASGMNATQTQPQQPTAAQSQLAKPVGTVKAIAGNTITLASDSGADVNVTVQDSTRIVRTIPGQKDLSKATPLQFQGVEVGDRVLARGQPSDDGKSINAISIIVMKKSDVDAMKQHERDDWVKRGIGGIVSAADAANSTVTISVSSFAGTKTVTIHATKDTVVKRYSPYSVNFDDAKASTLDQIKPGDQLRARGTLSDDGKDLAAEGIVSGTFLNIAGPILAVDPAAKTVTVTDLISKKPVVVKISADSQVRQIPPTMAQMIAMRFKGGAGGGQAGAGNAQGAPPAGQASGGQASGGNGGQGNGQGNGMSNGGQRPSGDGASQSGGGGARRGGGDLQQMLSRLPAATLSDLKKGDVVMAVSTQKNADGAVTAITMLSGVDAILTASPAASQAMLMTPWNLSAPSAEGMSP
jgi:exosome complex RNA-binding protein Csl4